MKTVHTKQDDEISKFKRFWTAFNSSFGVITGICSIVIAIGFGIFNYGGSTTAQAAEVQKLKDGQEDLRKTIEGRGIARDRQYESIINRMATKDDIEGIRKQIESGREDDKELRELMYRVLERR